MWFPPTWLGAAAVWKQGLLDWVQIRTPQPHLCWPLFPPLWTEDDDCTWITRWLGGLTVLTQPQLLSFLLPLKYQLKQLADLFGALSFRWETLTVYSTYQLQEHSPTALRKFKHKTLWVPYRWNTNSAHPRTPLPWPSALPRHKATLACLPQYKAKIITLINTHTISGEHHKSSHDLGHTWLAFSILFQVFPKLGHQQNCPKYRPDVQVPGP